MARDFSGTSQYGTFTGPAMAGDTTIMCWAKGDSWDVDADDFGVCGLFAPKGQWGSDAQGDVRLTIIKTGIATLSAVHFQVHTSGGDANSSYQLAGNGVTTGVWHHFLGEYVEGSVSQLYLDGTVHGSVTPTGTLTNRSTGGAVGAYPNNETGTEFDGKVAECAVWNRVLSSAEKDALAKGYSPLFFPRGLVFYLPLWGKSSPEPELIGKLEATITGATAVDGPPIIHRAGMPLRPGEVPPPPSPTFTQFGTLTREINPADYSPTVEFNFEAVLAGDGAATAYARLYNITDAAPVAGSEVSTANTDPTRVRTMAPITLPAGDKEYRAEKGGIAGDGDVTCYAADVIVDVDA